MESIDYIMNTAKSLSADSACANRLTDLHHLHDNTNYSHILVSGVITVSAKVVRKVTNSKYVNMLVRYIHIPNVFHL